MQSHFRVCVVLNSQLVTCVLSLTTKRMTVPCKVYLRSSLLATSSTLFKGTGHDHSQSLATQLPTTVLSRCVIRGTLARVAATQVPVVLSMCVASVPSMVSSVLIRVWSVAESPMRTLLFPDQRDRATSQAVQELGVLNHESWTRPQVGRLTCTP